MSAPERFAVIGHPISHSLSPQIHRLFGEQTGRALRYEAIDVAPEALGHQVHGFFAAGGRGLSVTIPHKQAVMPLLSQCGEAGRLAGAVNTLWRAADGGFAGDNTDGIGLVRDLCDNLGVRIAHSSVLLLGAGGASRGVLAPLLSMRPRTLLIANRDAARAATLVGEFHTIAAAAGVRLQAMGLSSLDTMAAEPVDLLLNATAASLAQQVPALPAGLIGTRTVCYDFAYGPKALGFLAAMRARGAAAAHDGLGMLVEQAAEAFRIWHGVRPETDSVLTALRAQQR